MSKPLHELRAVELSQGEDWEEKVVKGEWFHVVRDMVQKGEIARMGTVAWAVYCALKSYSDFKSGDSAPGVKHIATLIGTSHDTVQRALKTLVELGHVQVRKRGRSNIYSLTEKVDILTKDKEHYATAMRKYAGFQFQDFVAELKRFAETGNLPGDRAITFNVNVTVNNIQQGDNSQVTFGDIQNVSISGAHPPEHSVDQLAQEIRQRLKRIG